MYYFLIRYEIFENGHHVHSWHRITQSGQPNSEGRNVVEKGALEEYQKGNPD